MPRVLIAEDDQEIRKLVTFLLERDGYVIVAVEDGAQAIETLASESFDAILLDFMLPGATGLDVINWIEQNRPEVAKSCVLITAAVDQLKKFDTSKIYAAVAKPFDVFELRQMIGRCIENRKRES